MQQSQAGGGGGGGDPDILSNTQAGNPEKSQRYQASIRCWAIIGLPPKRHLNGVLLVGR